MKQFFKYVFASMLGVFFSLILFFILFMIILFGAISIVDSNKPVTLSSNSVLKLELNKPIPERSSSSPFNTIGLGSFSFNNIGLNDIIANIKKAKKDDNIKGIYLELSFIPSGIATIEEIRNALIDFKESKKFIIAYSENYTQTAYYLSSVADTIYLNPQGDLDFRGLKAELMFFKGTFDKLEIEPQIIRHGKFKSAVEPFISDKMSEENRHQLHSLINSIWYHLINNIAKSRQLEFSYLSNIANNLLIQNAKDAVKYKLADQLLYEDEVLTNLKKLLGIKESENVKFINLKKYQKVPDKSKRHLSANKIAVVYASGLISNSGEDDQTMSSEKITEALRKARTDKNIKAIVLRINSSGGSALASDIIWREVYLASQQKPVIASMGDVAASGGYYIACAADTIIAQPNTITGSIGVFGVLLNTQKFLNNKLGITIDTVKTGEYADIGAIYRSLTPSERTIIEKKIEDIYDTFITRVSDGRGIPKDQVDSIGEGRVWSGVEAKKINLVDILGGVNDAISIAAKMAKLDDYRILALPEQKEAFQQLFEEITGEVKASFIGNDLGNSYKYYKHLNSVLNSKGIQAKLPYEIELY